MYKINNIKTAFTITELIFTLLVITVVVFTTIPQAKKQSDDKINASRVKKNLNYAIRLQDEVTQNVGNIHALDWKSDWEDKNAKALVFQSWIKNMHLMKECGFKEGCWHTSKEPIYDYSGNLYSFNSQDYYMLELEDGSFWGFCSNGNCYNYSKSAKKENGTYAIERVFSDIVIDTNGRLAPNTIGKDIVFFKIMANGIVPFGYDIDYENDIHDCQKGSIGKDCAKRILNNETTIFN